MPYNLRNLLPSGRGNDLPLQGFDEGAEAAVTWSMQATLDEPHVVQNRGVMASERSSYRGQTRPVVAAEIHHNLPAESEMLSAVPRAELVGAEMKSLRDLFQDRIKMRRRRASRCFHLPVGRFSGADSIKLWMMRIGNCCG